MFFFYYDRKSIKVVHKSIKSSSVRDTHVEREGEERVEADQEHEEGRDEVINGCCAVIGSHEQRY